jgi:hypothetical protein
MAEEIACPACDTPNDPWNELCEACGAELHADADAAVHDDATDGDDFVEPAADGEVPGGFEDVEEVQAYDDDNPDYGVDADLADDDLGDGDLGDGDLGDGEQEYGEADDEIDEAFEHGDDELAEIPVEGYELAEDTGADDASFSPEEAHENEDQADVDYELEVIEPEADEADEADSDAWYDEESSPEDAQFDGGAPLDASPDDTFDNWDDDELAADGGAPFDAPYEDEFDELSEGGLPSEDTFADNVAEEVEEVEEVPPPPPELEEILNPTQLDRAPIEPLPTPGPFAELATLTVLRGGEELGEVAIDFNCTVLGLDSSDDVSADDALADDDAEELYELEAIEPVEADADEAAYENEADFEEEFAEEEFAEEEFAEEDAYELAPIDDESDEFEEPFDLTEESDPVVEPEMDEDSDWDDFDDSEAIADSEVDEEQEPEAAPTFEDPEDLEEGPVIDLGQFGDRERFARRHGYLFRQNKHYTLYVLSDMGTQVNDELLELGEHRELADGDVIVLGGEVALKFNKPAA